MVTTALEVVGLALIAVALGLTFGLGAFIGAAGVAFVVVGIALEGQARPNRADAGDSTSTSSTRSSS